MAIARGQPMLAEDVNNLIFFPAGTILTFSTAAWNKTANTTFRDHWKICNAANHALNPDIPDLTNKFLRGGENANFSATAGADSQTVDVSLRQHSHTFTGDNQTGNFYMYEVSCYRYDGVFSGSSTPGGGKAVYHISGGGGPCPAIRFSMTPTGTVSTEGGRTTDSVTINTVPVHYTVIYIMRVEPA